MRRCPSVLSSFPRITRKSLAPSVNYLRSYAVSADKYLEGRSALVTGSTSGIGLGIAKVLAGKGANVVLNGFGDKDQIEKIRLEIEKEHSVKALYFDADMSDAYEIEMLIKFCQQQLPALDIVVNNAGIQHTEEIHNFPTEKWDKILAINLSSAYHTMRLTIPSMRERKWGRIVNIASVHGLVASVKKSAYVAAKHGIIGLTKVAALENAGKGITANSICPGWVRTELVEKQIVAKAEESGDAIEKAAQNLLKEKQPSLEFVSTEQLGEVAAFLCSPAAAQITGVSLPVDGGWTAQ